MAAPNMEVISFKGDKNKWFDFVNVVKKRRERVWDALEQHIDSYIQQKQMAPISSKGKREALQNGKKPL